VTARLAGTVKPLPLLGRVLRTEWLKVLSILFCVVQRKRFPMRWR